MKTTIATLALAIASTAAQAEFYSGNELLARIHAESYTQRSVALGYVAGVHDAGKGANHCSPASATVGQVTDMVRQFLESTPGIRDRSADTIVAAVLKQAWPCKREPARGGSVL